MRRSLSLLALLTCIAGCSRPGAAGDGGNATTKPPVVPPLATTLPAPADPARESSAAVPTQIAMSMTHACARFSDDTLRCWGDNSFGELGNGDGLTQKGIVNAKIDGVVDVAMGYGITCARLRDHGLRCWGGNHNGAVDPNDAEVTRTTPMPIAGVEAVRSIGVDNYSGCAVTIDGAARCWGKLDASVDKKVGATPGALNALVRIAVSTSESCALRADGSLFCWGPNAGASIDRPRRVSLDGVVDFTLTAGGACAIVGGGKVACWGENNSGQLGEGAPAMVGIDAPRIIDGVSGVTSIAGGQAFTCAVRGDGAVLCWGALWANPDFPPECLKNTSNSSGGHGAGGSAAQWKYCATPTVVGGVTGAVQVAAGGTRTCVVTKSHDVVCWEGNASTKTAPAVMSWTAPADAGAPNH